MNKSNRVQVTISNRTVFRVIFIILATFLVIKFVSNIAQPLSLIFIAFFLAIALNPAVSFISKKLKVKNRALAVGIAYLTVVFVIVGFLWSIVPPLFSQTREFIDSLPETIASVNDQNSTLGRFVTTYDLQDQVENLSDDIATRAKNLPEPVISSAGRVGSAIVSTIAVLFMAFMMLIEGPGWKKEGLKLISSNKRQYYDKMLKRMYDVITSYVNGQLLIAGIAAVFAFFAMVVASTVFGVSINAVGLAGIIALTGLIPMIGTTLGASIIVLVSMLTSFPLAITMAIFFVVYQQIENVTIQPYIQSKKSELTPLLVFIAAIIGIGFGGLLGGFIAIPFAACLRILAVEYYENKIAKNQT